MSQEINRIASLKESMAALAATEFAESAEAIGHEIKRLQALLKTGALTQLQTNSVRDAMGPLNRLHNIMHLAAAEGAQAPIALPAPQPTVVAHPSRLRRRA